MRTGIFWPTKPMTVRGNALSSGASKDDLGACVDRLFDEWGARVYGYVRKMVASDEDAQDITQEVFIRAFRAGTVQVQKGEASIAKAWLFQVAHNLVIDYARRRRVRAATAVTLPLNDGLDEVMLAAGSQEPTVLDDEAKLRLQEAFDGLSDKLKSVIWLHDQEGLTYEEVARVLDVPLGTVKSRLFLARGQIAAAMRAYWQEGADV